MTSINDLCIQLIDLRAELDDLSNSIQTLGEYLSKRKITDAREYYDDIDEMNYLTKEYKELANKIIAIEDEIEVMRYGRY